MDGFVEGAFDVAIHDRRRGGKADFVRGLNQFNPLRGADASRRYLLTDFVD